MRQPLPPFLAFLSFELSHLDSVGAPAAFQWLMDRVLQPHRQYSEAYLNYIVVYCSTREHHLKWIATVLQSQREAGLTASSAK